MIWFILFTLVCIFSIARYFQFKGSRIAQLAAKLPGPPWLPLVGSALELGANLADLPQNIERLLKKYGPVLKLWVGQQLLVVVVEPENYEIILGSNKTIDKGRDYDFLKPWLGTGLLTSTGAKWKRHRKILTPTFHFKILEQFVDVFNANGEILVEKLQKEVRGPTFDIYQYITLYALDNICESAMGVQMNAQVNSNSKYVTAVREMTEVTMRRSTKPWLRPDFLFYLFPEGRLHNKCLTILHSSTKKVIEARKEELRESRKSAGSAEHDVTRQDGIKKRLAFLDLLIEASLDENNLLTDENIREEVDTFMFEGHDTTSSAICFALYLLSQHAHTQELAMAELDTIYADASAPTTLKHLQEMKYLERVIKETLRLYPSVPVFTRDVVEDITLHDGRIIPAGASVAILPPGTHRFESVFPDPETFDPDRFLPENCQGRHPYAYVPFSAGPRNCIGQKFAMLEIKCALSHVLRHYKLLPSPEEEAVEPSPELIIKSKTGFRLKLVPRNEDIPSPRA